MSYDEMIRCAGRELGIRRAVYPKWVAAKRMNQAEADFEIACMDEIYATLKRLKDTDRAAHIAKVPPVGGWHDDKPSEIPTSGHAEGDLDIACRKLKEGS